MSRAKMMYAQASDIRSRPFLEYRRDMKKKAIAELEFLPFLQGLLAEKYGDKSLRVAKHGVDAELWFIPRAELSRAPDYKATRGDGGEFLYEFQYAEEAAGLAYFDFKVSKVGKKTKGARTPHGDREFFYVVKSECKYAFIRPKWIMEKGKEGVVTAWGSRPAYRVPRKAFMNMLKKDSSGKMQKVIAAVNDKNTLLKFQHGFLDAEAERMSRRLRQGVDKKKIVKIMPKTPEGFYETCFLLGKLDKAPGDPGAWMMRLMPMLDGLKTPAEWARFVFALDFLYTKIADVRDGEKEALVKILKSLESAVSEYQRAKAPVNRGKSAEEIRQVLFAINLLEDLRQDAAVLLGAKLPKVKKIFETAANVPKIAKFIRDNNAAD